MIPLRYLPASALCTMTAAAFAHKYRVVLGRDGGGVWKYRREEEQKVEGDKTLIWNRREEMCMATCWYIVDIGDERP